MQMQILSRAREAFFFKPKILLKDLIKLTSLSGQECHTGMEFTEQWLLVQERRKLEVEGLALTQGVTKA